LETKSLTRTCNKCNIEKNIEMFEVKYFAKGREYHIHTCKKCKRQKTHAIRIAVISDSYIRELNNNRMTLTPELMEIKRKLLILKRNIKKIEYGKNTYDWKKNRKY
jgi:hypothetical protein